MFVENLFENRCVGVTDCTCRELDIVIGVFLGQKFGSFLGFVEVAFDDEFTVIVVGVSRLEKVDVSLVKLGVDCIHG